MLPLNLPPFDIKTKSHDERTQIYDFLRRRYVALTPEEWVRQHFTHYLVEHKGYPAALMANEVGVRVGGAARRCDTVLYSRDGGVPLAIMEYKAPHIEITQAVFTQIQSYNSVLRAPYLFVSNGLTHVCCRLDYAQNKVEYFREVPSFSDL